MNSILRDTPLAECTIAEDAIRPLFRMYRGISKITYLRYTICHRSRMQRSMHAISLCKVVKHLLPEKKRQFRTASKGHTRGIQGASKGHSETTLSN